MAFAANEGQYSVLSSAKNCFRQGKAKLHTSEHGIVYLYLALGGLLVLGEAKPSYVYQSMEWSIWPMRPIKVKKTIKAEKG